MMRNKCITFSLPKKNKQKRPTKASDYGRRHNGMAESTVTADSKLTSSDTRRRIWAIVGASSGNLVEWFDFYVYSFCSLYFAHIFFPSGNTTTQLLQTAGVFAAGFLMRPIGGWLFGRIADKHGRKKSMLLSVCMSAHWLSPVCQATKQSVPGLRHYCFSRVYSRDYPLAENMAPAPPI